MLYFNRYFLNYNLDHFTAKVTLLIQQCRLNILILNLKFYTKFFYFCTELRNFPYSLFLNRGEQNFPEKLSKILLKIDEGYLAKIPLLTF